MRDNELQLIIKYMQEGWPTWLFLKFYYKIRGELRVMNGLVNKGPLWDLLLVSAVYWRLMDYLEK